jgi:hypothetical protein|tara:strand:+ start:6455 stop:6703 length:249 start_codon:yes stop_codon:yes gene_type:complete
MIYYSVYDSEGKKVADCGAERDAKFLAESRKGTYRTNRLEYKETVTIEPLDNKKLTTIKIGGQEIQIQQHLPESNLSEISIE